MKLNEPVSYLDSHSSNVFKSVIETALIARWVQSDGEVKEKLPLQYIGLSFSLHASKAVDQWPPVVTTTRWAPTLLLLRWPTAMRITVLLLLP